MLEVQRDAFASALEAAKEVALHIVSDMATSPALGRKLTRQERTASAKAFVSDPGEQEKFYQMMQERYKLPAEQIPWRYLFRMAAALKDSAKDAAREDEEGEEIE